MLAAYTHPYSPDLGYARLAGRFSCRQTNDAHIFVSTYALQTPVQVTCDDGHCVPVVWMGTVTLPATLPFMQKVVYMLRQGSLSNAL